jgi:hypothetical protein
MRVERVEGKVFEGTREEERDFRDTTHMKALGSVRWPDFSEEEKIQLSLANYDRFLELRNKEYEVRVSSMQVPISLRTFFEVMSRTYGDTALVWGRPQTWPVAFMIARYGEEPNVWPTEFDQHDSIRATSWLLKNRWPNGVTREMDSGTIAKLKSGLGFIHTYLLFILATIFAVLGLFIDPKFFIAALGSAMTNFWENEHIDHDFRARAYTAPADHYIALFTAAPGEAGGGTEVSGGSYARVNLAAGFANWEGTGGETTDTDSAGTGGATQNRTTATYPAPTASWGVVSHMADMSAAAAGNMYWYAALAAAKTINNGDPAPNFPAGSIDFSFA